MSDVLGAIMSQYEKNKSNSGGGKTFEEKDFSKYFNPRLEDGEKNGEATIRLMPAKEKGGSPFEEGFFHVMQVNGQWRKLYCKEHNDGETCPLCEVRKALEATGSEEDKKIAKTYKPAKFYLARVIDRSKEEDGIKIWRFRHNYKGEGELDKMIPLFTKKGDLSDPREGRDLILMLGRGDKNNTKVTSVMAEDPSMLTNDKTKANAWVKDASTWKDVYKASPIEYLEIIANGESPVWDKNLKKFVAKGEEVSKQSGTTSAAKPATYTAPSTDDSEEGEDDEMPF
jgi:gp32 DNA binding protein like